MGKHPDERVLVWGRSMRGFKAILFPKIEVGELA